MALYTVDIKDSAGVDVTGKIGFRSYPDTLCGFDKACGYADALAELYGVTATVSLESDEEHAEYSETVYVAYSEPERRTTVRWPPPADLISAYAEEDDDVGF